MLTPRVQQLESQLAQAKPFGDPDYISECLWRVYRRRLERLSARETSANDICRLVEGLASHDRAYVGRDPGFRLSIDLATTALFVEHRQDCSPQVRTALLFIKDRLVDGEKTSFLFPERCSRIQLADKYSFIWQEEGHEDNPCRQLFKERFDSLLGAAGFTLIQPTQKIITRLQEGERILSATLPALTESSLVHAPLVAIFTHPGGVLSVTNPHIPGVVFLAEAAVTNGWKAGDLILHEATHNKDVELENTHRLLPATPIGDSYEPPVIQPPWRRAYSFDASAWTPKHALTVLHTYVTLACFYAATIDTGTATSEGVSQTAPSLLREALDRTGYLAEQLMLIKDELGPAGLLMTEWIARLVKEFDLNPRTQGAILHHVVSLYQKDTRLVSTMLSTTINRASAAPHPGLNVMRVKLRELLSRDNEVLQLLQSRGAPIVRERPQGDPIELDAPSSTLEILLMHWQNERRDTISQITQCSAEWETSTSNSRMVGSKGLETRLAEIIAVSSPNYEWFANALASLVAA